MFESALVILLAALAGIWFESLGRREAAVDAARRACLAEGVQFLDDTVALASLRARRATDGRLTLQRVYRFEFSDTGNNRLAGSVTLFGSSVQTLYLEPHTGDAPGAPGALPERTSRSPLWHYKPR